MASGPRVNVFVSHRWEQDAHEEDILKDWLQEDDYYDFRMHDITKEHIITKGSVEQEIKKIYPTQIYLLHLIIYHIHLMKEKIHEWILN